MPKEIVIESNRVELKGRTQKLRNKAKTHPGGIEIETCVAPECNLSQKDVKLFLDELKKYMKLFKGAFQRMEQIKKSRTYMNGLLGNIARKNVEQMALGMREKVRSLQYFVGQTESVIAIHQGLIGESLGEEDGVMLIDESSSVKQGTKSVGVAAQSETNSHRHSKQNDDWLAYARHGWKSVPVSDCGHGGIPAYRGEIPAPCSRSRKNIGTMWRQSALPA